MTTDKTTISVRLDDMTLDQLVEVSQGIGREVDKLREQRAYLNTRIAARLAANERNSEPGESVSAIAAGVVLKVKAK